MDAIRMEIIHQAARDRFAAPHGQQGQIIERAARTLGLSLPRTHALVSQASRALQLSKPRKRRCDAGEMVYTDADLMLISGTMMSARRAGKWELSCEAAIDMLFEAGKISARLSPGRTLQVLRNRGMHPTQLAQPSPSVRMRTEHPNAVWQIDASVCVLYRTPKGELLLLEEDGVHYKNKLHNYTKVMNDLLVRYVGVDHTSAPIATRFYLGGETAINALDFLMWMMTQRFDAQGQPMPFYGVPRELYTDQGSAFRAAEFTNFCSVMGIKLYHHKPKNSRATGSVENAQNLVERGIESRLRFLDPNSITMDRLQAMAELWMHWFNSTRTHSRHGMSRYACWSLITEEQLTIAPPLEVMQSLPATLAKTRKVSTNMQVSFAYKDLGSKDYDVRYVPGISPGSQVYVTVNPLALPSVRVGVTDLSTGEIVWHQVQPVQLDRFGFAVDAPKLGQTYAAMPDTPSDTYRKAIAAQAYATPEGPATVAQSDEAIKRKQAPYLGQFDPLADLKAAKVPAYLPRKGSVHDAVAPSIEVTKLSVAEACKRIKLALGDDYDIGTYAWLNERYGSAGVPEDVVQSMIAQRRQAAVAVPQVGLRAVGGGV